jgi:hypothetical protein
MGVGDQRHAPAALTPGKETRYPLCSRLGRPQGRSGRVWKTSPPLGFDPRTVQPLASRYSDWAIPAHESFHWGFKNQAHKKYVQICERASRYIVLWGEPMYNDKVSEREYSHIFSHLTSRHWNDGCQRRETLAVWSHVVIKTVTEQCLTCVLRAVSFV